MDEFVFAREMGCQLSADLELFWRSRLFNDMQKAHLLSSAPDPHPRGVNSLALEHTERRFLVSGGSDGTLALWDLWGSDNDGVASFTMKRARAHGYGISSIGFYPPDAGLFVTTSFDRSVKVWDSQEMMAVCSFDLHVPVNSAALASRGNHSLVAVGSESPGVSLLDLNTGSSAQSLVSPSKGYIPVVAWSPTNEFLLVSGDTEGIARLWDIRMAAGCLLCFDMTDTGRAPTDSRNRAHEGVINGLSWRHEGTGLFTYGSDEKLRCWELFDGRQSLVSFGGVLRNARMQVANPVVIPHRHCEPPRVFVMSDTEIIGFDASQGSVLDKIGLSSGHVNALIYREDRPDLIYGTSSGAIGLLRSKYFNACSWRGGAHDNSQCETLENIYQCILEEVWSKNV